MTNEVRRTQILKTHERLLICRQAMQIQMPQYTASETHEYMPKRGHPARRCRQRTVCPVL